MKKIMILTAAAVLFSSSAMQAAGKPSHAIHNNAGSNIQLHNNNFKPSFVVHPTNKPVNILPITSHHSNFGSSILVNNLKPHYQTFGVPTTFSKPCYASYCGFSPWYYCFGYPYPIWYWRYPTCGVGFPFGW